MATVTVGLGRRRWRWPLIKWRWGRRARERGGAPWGRGAGGGVQRAGRGERRAGFIPPRAAPQTARSPRARAMVARTDEMFGCYGDSYSYRLWSLANVWGACRCE
ncbi:unnamed protein product, partial [Iphiclides podalirius]